MNVQFLLFVIAILLVMIFWELSKINSFLKRLSLPARTSRPRTNIKNPEKQEAGSDPCDL